MECSNGAFKTAFDIQVDGKCVLERSKMIWQQLTEGLQRVEALGYRPSTLMIDIPGDLVGDLLMHTARGPTDVDVAPLPAC